MSADSLPAALALAFALASIFLGASGERRALLRCIAWTLLGMFVAARLIFIWQNRQGYLHEPLEVLNLLDGGWDAQLGVMAGWMGAILAMRERPALRKRVARVLGIGTATWIIASLAMLFAPGHEAVRLEHLAATDKGGAQVTFDQFRGKPTVVNLWATWCPPCQRELPLLARAQAQRTDANIVLVNQGEATPAAMDFLRKHGLEFRDSYLDQRGQVKLKLAPPALPATYFFDASGHLRDVYVGELSSEALTERLKKIDHTTSDTASSAVTR